MGCLFGVACGDALGATLEFMKREDIRGKYGKVKDIIGGGYWQIKPGDITDDTNMTLAVGWGIIENPTNPIPEIGERFIKWFKTDPPDIGGTTKLALNLYYNNGDWEKTANEVLKVRGDHSAGNGSLMRTAPVSLAYSNSQKIRKVAVSQSKLTHPHPDALAACEMYCLMLDKILKGLSLKEAVWEVLNEEDDKDCYKTFLKNSVKDDLIASGYVVNTLRTALWCLLHTNSFEEALVTVVNLGDDADTTGAVTGGLAGAYYGYNKIPDKWKHIIICKEELKMMAENLFALRDTF